MTGFFENGAPLGDHSDRQSSAISIIIISSITVFAGVLFIYQPGANPAPKTEFSLLLAVFYDHLLITS